MVQPVGPEPSRRHSKLPDSLEAEVNVAVCTLVGRGGFEALSIVTVGAVASIVQRECAGLGSTWPTFVASVPRTSKVCEPVGLSSGNVDAGGAGGQAGVGSRRWRHSKLTDSLEV